MKQKSEQLLTAMGQIDDKLIRDAVNDRPKEKAKGLLRKKWLIPLAAALVCMAIVITAISRPDLFGYVPTTEDAYLSAHQVASLFGSLKDNGATTNYTEVYWSADRPLQVDSLPTGEYVTVYQLRNASQKLSAKELNALVERVLPKLAAATDADVNTFEEHRMEQDHRLSVTFSKENHGGSTLWNFDHSAGGDDRVANMACNSVFIYNGNAPLMLEEKTVQVDVRQSEAQILTSLEWVRDLLFDVFGRQFDSAEVNFYYSSNGNPVSEIEVRYFNKTDLPYVSDYIALYFSSFDRFGDNGDSGNTLDKCNIRYQEGRRAAADHYEADMNCRLLTLEEAEALLAKGYVFGGHSCSLCMAEQEAVSFDDYDTVGFEYVSDREAGWAVPFYTFYKQIGQVDNGNLIYAKTYVCAVEVADMEEYFRAQETDHGSNAVAVTTAQTRIP